MTASTSTPSISKAPSSASSRTYQSPVPAVSTQQQSKRISFAPSASAGASSASAALGASQNSSRAVSGSSRPARLISTMNAPAPPQREINEKVRDAFEDLELSKISPQLAVFPVRQNSSQSQGPIRSRSREASRGRRSERTDRRSLADREWDEKRGLGIMPGNAGPIPGPSNTRPPLSPQQVRSGTVQAPIRSSSLTTASFAHHTGRTHASSNTSCAPPPYTPLPSFSSSALPSYPNNYAPYSLSVRRMLLTERIRPWLPFIAYGATIVGFGLAIAFWKEEVFGGLDELAQWLRAEGETGYAYMFFMIFLTCIPPVPLYSTLQILSGYTFGAWTGAVVSYVSALAGAVFVFSLSRSIPALRCAITSCMSRSRGLQRVVRAISKRPSLLFLVRLAPYPYNVLNALLAGCPRLTFQTYFVCTALSLLKVIIHTSVGAGIKNFAEYHTAPKKGESSTSSSESTEEGSSLGQMSTILGVGLCIFIAIYLTYVARRAVDEELDDDDEDVECARGRSRLRARVQYGVRTDDEESVGFLDESDTDGFGLGADFAALQSAVPVRAGDRVNAMESGEMVERDTASRLGASSPVPLSSLSAMPYGPPEWSQ